MLSFLAQWWVGDHTLVLVTQRQFLGRTGTDNNSNSSNTSDSNSSDNGNNNAFCIETFSRAVTSASLGRGDPQPEKHSVVVLDLEGDKGPLEGPLGVPAGGSGTTGGKEPTIPLNGDPLNGDQGEQSGPAVKVFVPVYFDMGQTRVLTAEGTSRILLIRPLLSVCLHVSMSLSLVLSYKLPSYVSLAPSC